MVRVFASVGRIGASGVPVLLRGETGTGKEVVARALHEASSRRAGPFRCVNCGGLPEGLIEATLFGHERGAFTGANDRKAGVFEAAAGGTVFLDEIGEMSPGAQASILRVLESKKVVRVGGVEEIPVDARVVSATHRDLESMCERGLFRWDLFYRLDVVSLALPPLRERPEDVEPLAERFLCEAAAAQGRPPPSLSGDARAAMRAHSWPGNVRELKNAMERAVAIGTKDLVRAEDLPLTVRRQPAGLRTLEPPPPAALAVEPCEDGPTEDLGELDYRSQLREAERQILLRGLERARWNQTEAARVLRMPLRTLVHKITGLDLRPRIEAQKRRRRRF